MIGAISYIILGILFTYLAFLYASETIWNPITIFLLILATIDFGLGITFIRKHFRHKNEKND